MVTRRFVRRTVEHVQIDDVAHLIANEPHSMELGEYGLEINIFANPMDILEFVEQELAATLFGYLSD